MLRHSGVGTYLRGLLKEYPGQSFFKKHSFAVALSPHLFQQVNGQEKLLPFHSPIYSVREQIEYPFRLAGCRLWHAPHYNIPFIKRGARLVVTIHDLIHWIFRKEFYSFSQAIYARLSFQRVVSLADQIIAVSQQTRDDLIQYFNARPERIEVIHEGVSPEFFQIPNSMEQKTVLERHGLPENFSFT